MGVIRPGAVERSSVVAGNQRRGNGAIWAFADLREGALGEDSTRRADVSITRDDVWGGEAIDGSQAEAYINRQVLPQAPSPTMTSLRRISAIFVGGGAKVSGLD